MHRSTLRQLLQKQVVKGPRAPRNGGRSDPNDPDPTTLGAASGGGDIVAPPMVIKDEDDTNRLFVKMQSDQTMAGIVGGVAQAAGKTLDESLSQGTSNIAIIDTH